MNLIKVYFFSVLFIVYNHAVLADDGGGGGGGSPVELAAYQGKQNSTSAALLHSATAINLSRGAGISVSSQVNYNAKSFDQSTLANAISNNDYIEWSIKADANVVLEITEITLNYHRDTDGPTQLALRSSLDSYGSDVFSDASVSTTSQTHVIGLSGASLLYCSDGDDITFRLYGYGANSSTGVLFIDSTVTTSSLSLSDVGILIKGNAYSTGLSSVGFDNSFPTVTETDASQTLLLPVSMSNYEEDCTFNVTIHDSPFNDAEDGDYTLQTSSI